jgi:hypothetical protein
MEKNPDASPSIKESAFTLRGISKRIMDLTVNRLVMTGAWDFSNHAILPHTTREALHRNKQTLSGDEIADLAGASEYSPVAFYLFMKGLETDRNSQRAVLQQAVIAESENVNYSSRLADIVRSNAALLPRGERVPAAKVSQISRMSPKLWEDRFNEMGEVLKSEHKGRTKFVLAYASLVGLRQMSKFSRETGEPIHLLIEKWYQDPQEPVCGYTIDAARKSVHFLERDFPRPKDFVTIDDTVSKWRHFRRMWSFITQEDAESLIIDPARTFVIDKTSPDCSANPSRKFNPEELLMG